MSQQDYITLFYKIFLCMDEVACLAFVLVYTWLAPWWRKTNPLGRTIVRLDILIALALLPAVLSIFLHFNRLTSTVAAWIDVSIFGLIALEFLIRIPLFIKLHYREDGVHGADIRKFVRDKIHPHREEAEKNAS